jgi:phenylacetic acid degradation operon negative regulatory protein
VDSPSPRSLILDLLTTLRRGSMPVGALVEAGALFGLAGGTLRVALARLVAAGQVERDARGRYRMGERAAPIQRAIEGWRSESRTRPWDGSWWAVHSAPAPARAARSRHARALRLLGFRELSPGLDVRPANLAGDCAAAREQLTALGLAHGSLVFTLSDLDPVTDTRARALWDAAGLRAGYRRSLDALAASEARLDALSERDAMCESFLVGGRMIQQLVLDPLLPEAILDPADRHALVEAMRRYDRRGRACWAGLLARFDVPNVRTPADTGLPAGAARLDAA